MRMSVETTTALETLPTIELSPERVAKALDLEHDEVLEQLHSVEGRKQLLADLQRNPELLASAINPDSLRMFEQDMEIVEQDLQAEQRFLEAQKDPEKKGMFRRAWDTMTSFPRKHPVITVALLGVVLGVVASYMGWLPPFNFGGLWGRAQGWLGWGAAGEVAGEATAVETVAGEAAVTGAYETGEAVLPAAIEAPIGTEIPLEAMVDDLKLHTIRPFEFNGVQHYLYDNEIYSMEELPALMKKLPMAAEGYVKHPEFTEMVRVLPFASARPSGEIALTEALEKLGIEWNIPSQSFKDITDFVPDPVKYPKFVPMPLQLPE